MPTSAIEPISAPVAAPIARPRIGMKKMRPNSSPQKPPPSAPAFLVSRFAGLRLVLADFPADHGRVEYLDELLALQVGQSVERLLGAVRGLELPDG